MARVGNAIARYLREARPQSASRVVFLRLRAPYGSRNIGTRRYDVKDDSTQPFRVFWAN